MADMAVTILQAVATAEATEAIFRQLLPVAVMAVDMGGATEEMVVEAMEVVVNPPGGGSGGGSGSHPGSGNGSGNGNGSYNPPSGNNGSQLGSGKQAANTKTDKTKLRMPDSNPDEDDDTRLDSKKTGKDDDTRLDNKKTGKAKPNDKQSARKPDRM